MGYVKWSIGLRDGIGRRAVLAMAVATAPLSVGAQIPLATGQSIQVPEGDTVWVGIPAGRLKTRLYRSTRTSGHPVLVLFVHGDISVPREDQYRFSQMVAHSSDDVVAAGVLRPGYSDPSGDTSSGKLAYAIGDNYTADVVDAVDTAIRQLRAMVQARAVILVGHSGGAAIVADLMGRHPGDAQGALLVACGCDPKEFMTRWTAEHPGLPKGLQNPSLLPLDLAHSVSATAHVRMVIGDHDDVVRPPATLAYAMALQTHGIDVHVITVPGGGHNDVVFAPPTYQALSELISLYGSAFHPFPQPSGAKP